MKYPKFYYSFNEKCPKSGEWEEAPDYCNGYHQTAEDVCFIKDNDAAEYPDKRKVWVLMEGHDTPRLFEVCAENVRNYQAYEEDV